MMQTKRKANRRFVTLLEMLIAITLAMLVLSALAYFYRQIDSINQAAEVQQGELFKRLYLSTRLTDIIPKAVSPQSKKGDFYFYTNTGGNASLLPNSANLIFTYDNGIKLDQQFSNHVLGRLFVDKEKRLCIAVWPSTDRWEEFHTPQMKCEVLMEGVEGMSFRFYIPPKREWEKVWQLGKMKKVKVPENMPLTDVGEWRTDWPAGWEQLPAIVEIILKMGKDKPPLVLAYPLPNSNFMVMY